jgi:dCMP deaminase
MSRLTKVEYFLKMAHLVSLRATCKRRAVGCVIVNLKGHVLATGYNGVASGRKHCIDSPCKGAACESGKGLELCEAIHAEMNALLQCQDVQKIHTVYCTTSPCMHCLKLFLNTSCEVIVFSKEYIHSDSKRLWEESGRIWINASNFTI